MRDFVPIGYVNEEFCPDRLCQCCPDWLSVKGCPRDYVQNALCPDGLCPWGYIKVVMSMIDFFRRA